MKKTFKIIYIIIFFVICAAPLCLMPVAPDNGEIEKRELTKFPAYMAEGRLNVDFSNQFESWLNDRIPYRAELLAASNTIKSELLHAPSSNVIVGKDGWLFYETESADYMDTNAMTDDQIRAAAVTLSLIEENIEDRGGHFLFVPMPNKASVYDEYMPSCYRKAESNNLTRLTNELKNYNVKFADMKELLREHKAEGLYHRRDSHWNYKGALLGYYTITNMLKGSCKDYSSAAVTQTKDWRADLDKLLYPAGGYMDYQYYYDIKYDNFMFTSPAGVRDTKEQLLNFMSDKEQGDDYFVTINRDIKDGSSLYMVRDSFGRALLPFMIDNYENAAFKRTDCPDVNSIKDGTDLCYEIVERNLSRIVQTAPFMYAPVRAAAPDAATSGGSCTAICKKEGYGVRIYGEFAYDTDMGDSRVYLEIENSEGMRTFEAFPIYETKLMNSVDGTDKNTDTETNKKGFSAIISTEEELSGEYALRVIVGGKVYDAGKITVQ
ncbi:MAG: hypothetical protein IKO61_02835 [Lachnospiraceae bacterium]|nr:hypothetical protein [Lachnospiraceae bacterium]